jgi:hypothetical protein
MVLFAGWLTAVGVMVATAARPRRTTEGWVAGGLAVGAFAGTVLAIPGGNRAGRLAPPWSAPPPVARLTVPGGDPVVPRHSTATLVCVADPPDLTPRLELESGAPPGLYVEGPGVFVGRVPVADRPTRFRFTAGQVQTGWHAVRPVEPVRVTGGELRAEPPPHLTGSVPARAFAPTSAVVGVAGGRLIGRLALNRTAQAARAEWHSDGQVSAASTALCGDCVRFDLPTTNSGRLRLSLTADGLTSVMEVAVAVEPDRLPAFVSVAGIDAGVWRLNPNDRPTVTVEAADEVWAAPPTLAAVAASGGRTEVRLSPVGGGRFAGTAALPTPPARVRLELTDGSGRPPVAFPADWVELVPHPDAPPLAEQVIVSQRDRLAADPARVLTAFAHVAELDPLADLARRSADLATLRDMNRRLADARLDRVRLLRLADDPGRSSERLAAVVALSPRLTAARLAAGRRRFHLSAGALADELSRVAGEARAAAIDRGRPLVDRLSELARRHPGDSPWLSEAAAAVRSGRPALALAPLAAGRQGLTAAADEHDRQADARRDPGRAAAQLARWRPVDLADAVLRGLAAREIESASRHQRAVGPPVSFAIRVKNLLGRLDDPAAVAAGLRDLPPAELSPWTELAAAAAARLADDRHPHDRAAGRTELRWRLELLLDPGDPLADLDRSDEARLAGWANRVGVAPGPGLRAAVRARLLGEDREVGRLTRVADWWQAGPTFGPERWRQLARLLETVRGGGVVQSAVQTALTGWRSPQALGECQARLQAARDEMAGRPECNAPLAPVGPPKPTPADRLVWLDTGGRLPTPASAADLRRAAEAVAALMTEVATLAAVQPARKPDLVPLAELRQLAEVAGVSAGRLHQIENRLRKPGATADDWQAAADELRELVPTDQRAGGGRLGELFAESGMTADRERLARLLRDAADSPP